MTEENRPTGSLTGHQRPSRFVIKRPPINLERKASEEKLLLSNSGSTGTSTINSFSDFSKSPLESPISDQDNKKNVAFSNYTTHYTIHDGTMGSEFRKVLNKHVHESAKVNRHNAPVVSQSYIQNLSKLEQAKLCTLGNLKICSTGK